MANWRHQLKHDKEDEEHIQKLNARDNINTQVGRSKGAEDEEFDSDDELIVLEGTGELHQAEPNDLLQLVRNNKMSSVNLRDGGLVKKGVKAQKVCEYCSTDYPELMLL
jgi:hypothetical protein